MRPRTPYRRIAILLAFLVSTSVFAQSSIRGVVVDSLTAKPLVGANVYLLGTAFGCATDLEGTFRIDRVPPGAYTLRVTYIGYRTQDRPISLAYGQTLQISVSLAQDVILGETVVVTGQAVGQAAAINQQINAPTIVNVVSEEKIQELPDVNAAEAIGRLPGVSIRRSGGEANKVVLRGVSDKYSSITVDGVRIAPTDADARGVDLSMISQGSLAGIELYKALTADKDADAIAGSVNMVTKRAPADRLLRLDLRGAYNQMDEDAKQYDIGLKYGERFFGSLLGVQVTGNLERRNRSREMYDLDYNQERGIPAGSDYEITDFALNYTHEIRSRQGVGLLLDLYTPDGGSIRFNNLFNRTYRDYISYERNYPTTGEELFYNFRDREQEIRSFSSGLLGENYTPWFRVDWGAYYSESRSKFPFDFELDFTEPSMLVDGQIVSHMRPIPDSLRHGPPEAFIPYAMNNFDAASLYTSYYRNERNKDIERSAYLNLTREYAWGRFLSGSLKIGGKYRDRARDRSRHELFSPYYNTAIAQYVESNGVIVPKDYTGTRFEDLKTVGLNILMSNFLDDPPVNRKLFGKYDLYPLINRDAMRFWWDYNRRGYHDPEGKNPEYKVNLEPDAQYYDITERVYAAYAMHTLHLGRKVTLITGVRMEHEKDDYACRYTPITLSGFPVPTGVIRDTSDVHEETLWLPNFHLTVRPAGFMNVRLAAYEALARPDFNHRLPSVVKKARSTFFPGNNMYVGNPGLKAAKAWNYEVNTSFFGNKIGLFSVSVFYKDIRDMFQLIDGLPVTGQDVLDSLGIKIDRPFGDNKDPIVLTYPFNSTHPTIVKGIEIEHQTNLRFLPGLLKNLVLSYNLSFVRSQTYVPFDKDTTVYVKPLPWFPPVPVTYHRPAEQKQKLQDQPEFFGNFAVGYDIGGFSIRLSMFHQGQFNRTFSPTGRNDSVVDAFTRWDLAIKQEVNSHVSILLNVNNLTNTEEGNTTLNRKQNWRLINMREVYGLTADLGVRITL